ncbi:CinA family protein [candidate division KSB1 bacterium]|nr:CinA family protein [candidate division KSB1 bacterium]
MTYSYLVERLSMSSRTLATAESCTGGLIAKLITDVPGSSRVFIGGVVTYNNSMKSKLLRVKPSTLAEFGAVSNETVTEMVKGVIRLMNSDYGIAISGIAGPAGGSTVKPVGTVFIGTGWSKEILVKHYLFQGSRELVREKSTMAVLEQLIQFIDKIEQER